nr:WYL domain-containing protein [Corynebacterium aquatimens]
MVRSLNLIPYLHQHPNSTPMEIARDLGQTHEEVMEDLRRLQFSGRSKVAGELIDLAADWTGITIIDDQGLNTALRMTPTEANALLLTLESLETMPALVNHGAVTSAAAKIRAVMSSAGVDDVVHPNEEGHAGVLALALTQRRQVEVTYYSASSDTTTTRVVSPLSFFHRDGNTYLSAVENGTQKSFRLDRVRHAELLDSPSEGSAQDFDDADPFGFSGRNVAQLRIRSEATWLADYWQIELGNSNATDCTDGGTDSWVDARMPYGSEEWLVRFCLSQADRLELVSPVKLREEVARRGKDGQGAYA